jgi:hypothetical protein
MKVFHLRFHAFFQDETFPLLLETWPSVFGSKILPLFPMGMVTFSNSLYLPMVMI